MDLRNPERADSVRWSLWRQDRRTARRLAVEELGYRLALDSVDLAQALDLQDVSSRGNLLKRRALARAAVHAGVSPEELAAAWNLTVEQVAADIAAPLLDQSGAASRIDADLAARFPDVARDLARASGTASF